MRTIHKVILYAGQPCPQVHQLPFGAKPLHVDRDTRERAIDAVACWFEVEDTAQMVGHQFWIARTGEDRMPPGLHIGSVVRETMAWHVYWGGGR